MWEKNKEEYVRLLKLTSDFIETHFFSIILLMMREEDENLEFPSTNSSKTSSAFLLLKDKIEKKEICKKIIEEGTVVALEVCREVKSFEEKSSKGN